MKTIHIVLALLVSTSAIARDPQSAKEVGYSGGLWNTFETSCGVKGAGTWWLEAMRTKALTTTYYNDLENFKAGESLGISAAARAFRIDANGFCRAMLEYKSRIDFFPTDAWWGTLR